MISCNFGCFLRCVCLSREAEKQRSREAEKLAANWAWNGMSETEGRNRGRGRGRAYWNKTTNRMENRKRGKEENGMLDQ